MLLSGWKERIRCYSWRKLQLISRLIGIICLRSTRIGFVWGLCVISNFRGRRNILRIRRRISQLLFSIFMVEGTNYIQFRFISLSSRSHQTYTRKWAKKCEVPVFSVDYRKAPEAPYPAGLADCWQVYNWLLNESHKFFKIKSNKRIIISGDSAGGNLAFSVTNLCLENKIPKPFSIVTFYPGNISPLFSCKPQHKSIHPKFPLLLWRSTHIFPVSHHLFVFVYHKWVDVALNRLFYLSFSDAWSTHIAVSSCEDFSRQSRSTAWRRSTLCIKNSVTVYLMQA